jgi:sulfite reductase beta subunit-like hemoprotein
MYLGQIRKPAEISRKVCDDMLYIIARQSIQICEVNVDNSGQVTDMRLQVGLSLRKNTGATVGSTTVCDLTEGDVIALPDHLEIEEIQTFMDWIRKPFSLSNPHI